MASENSENTFEKDVKEQLPDSKAAIVSFICSIIGVIIVSLFLLDLLTPGLITLGFVLSWSFSVFGGIMTIIAFIFGIIGIRRKQRIYFAIIGFLISSITLLVAIGFSIFVLLIVLSW